MSAIREMKGRQILDSRGNPTVGLYMAALSPT